MDKKTEQLLKVCELAVEVAEDKINSVDSADELAGAIGVAYSLNGMIGQLEKRRTDTNAASQKKVREHTTWFKPMITRLEAHKNKLRALILEWMAPDGKIGNLAVEDVRAFGLDGVGNASLVEITTYEIDLPKLVKAHPELVQADMAAIKKAYAAGEKPTGTKPAKTFQLRIN
jgi:hypothetical protein